MYSYKKKPLLQIRNNLPFLVLLWTRHNSDTTISIITAPANAIITRNHHWLWNDLATAICSVMRNSMFTEWIIYSSQYCSNIKLPVLNLNTWWKWGELTVINCGRLLFFRINKNYKWNENLLYWEVRSLKASRNWHLKKIILYEFWMFKKS